MAQMIAGFFSVLVPSVFFVLGLFQVSGLLAVFPGPGWQIYFFS